MPAITRALKATLTQIAQSPAARSPKVSEPPRKILILQPCCLGKVMLTTPLLAALSDGFPDARIDWAVSDWALPAIGTNRRITRIIRTGPGDLEANDRAGKHALVEIIRHEAYDACFIPSQSSALIEVAGQAGIPRLFGFNVRGRGFGRRFAEQAMPVERLQARRFLSLAHAAGIEQSIMDKVEMEFEPPDVDRTTITNWLVEELDWLGDTPLVILHPGGGENPSQFNIDKRWPAHRFARLANYLSRVHRARVVVTGTAEERFVAEQVVGMMSFPAANQAGKIGLGELGALCELASLYVGNDVGSTYIAAATGCPTLAIYGPTDPGIYGPYMINGRVKTLWRPFEGEFDWANGVSVEDASAAADELLAVNRQPANPIG